MQRLLNCFNLLIWPVALLMLYGLDASDAGSWCVFRLLGFGACPGCGLGHAVHLVLHGQPAASLQHHWLGIPATTALFYLAFKPFFAYIKTKRQHGSENAYDASGAATQ